MFTSHLITHESTACCLERRETAPSAGSKSSAAPGDGTATNRVEGFENYSVTRERVFAAKIFTTDSFGAAETSTGKIPHANKITAWSISARLYRKNC
jgi:hypothetical protein